MNNRFLYAALLSGVAALTGCNGATKEEARAPVASASEIAWRHGDVADAFAEAAEQGKPVLLYWGAVWCPPCNQLKAGLFRNPEFVARTRDVIPVYLDGDSAGAQAWGERFGITGYPTLIVLRPDRSEVTRLSGTGDPGQVTAALNAVHKGDSSIDRLLQKVDSGDRGLSTDDWALLASYGGWYDPRRADGAAETLTKLAAVAPSDKLRRQFTLQAIANRPEKAPPLAPPAQAQTRDSLAKVLADPAEVRANRATLAHSAVELTHAVAPNDAAARVRTGDAIVAALDRLYEDDKLVASERLSSIGAALALFRDQHGEDARVPDRLLAKVRARVAWAARSVESPYERQSVISSAAHYLADAGDGAGATRLLEAELKKSRTPYYYMPALAELAEERGDKAAALDWLRRGYETSEGPASRVQWGVTYVEGLLRLKPEDNAGIEKASASIISELANQPDGYRQRTRQRLEKLGNQLAVWSSKHDGIRTLAQLRSHNEKACSGQRDPAALSACRAWIPVSASHDQVAGKLARILHLA